MILIKGREMPKSCYVCPCFNDEYYDCQATGKDLGSIPIDSRHSDCPLVEVPPHGRLIDADKIGYHSGTWEKGFDWVMQSEIALMPTVIPADKDGESR